MSQNFHEQLQRGPHALPSDRSTGLVFAAASTVIAWFWQSEPAVLAVAAGAAALFLAASLIRPRLLHPLNVAWMSLALVLARIVNPVVMLVLYAALIVPAGLIMQLRRDPLRRTRRPGQDSYWIEPDRQQHNNMRNQF